MPRTETSPQHSPLLSPWLQDCPQLSFCTDPSPLLAPGTIHCFLWFGFPSLGRVSSPAQQGGNALHAATQNPHPLHSCFSLLFFLLFHSSLIYYFPFSPSKPPQAPSDIPQQTILPLPLPHPCLLLLLLSWLGVWAAGTKSGHAKSHPAPFHTFDSSFPTFPVQT